MPQSQVLSTSFWRVLLFSRYQRPNLSRFFEGRWSVYGARGARFSKDFDVWHLKSPNFFWPAGASPRKKNSQHSEKELKTGNSHSFPGKWRTLSSLQWPPVSHGGQYQCCGWPDSHLGPWWCPLGDPTVALPKPTLILPNVCNGHV